MMQNLFTVQQETALEEKISQVKEQAALDLVIVTALSTGNKDAQAYADDFFDDGGFGMGDDNSGVLLLIDMGASEVAVSTTGYGIRLLSDARIDKILDEVVGFLIDGESALAAQAFVERVADYASQDVSQTVSHAENEQEKTAPLQKKKTIGRDHGSNVANQLAYRIFGGWNALFYPRRIRRNKAASKILSLLQFFVVVSKRKQTGG